MATLVLTAVGSLFGPLGGAIGAVIGRQIDGRILGPSSAKGPRLKELSVTTSSYGQAIARHYGRMRVGGSIIWSTDLVERRERSGGGKGRPKVTTYSYSVSFAVALASRPVLSVGRVWADGNLLRGSAGDLKTAGQFRLHRGLRDQQPDPLILAAEGAGQCPAFRGIAYAVFEDLELGDFGNRIPALTFEVMADNGEVSLLHVVGDAMDGADAAVALPGLAGLTVESSLADAVAMLEAAYPLDCDASGKALVFRPERLQPGPVALDEPAIAVADGDFGGNEGRRRQVRPAAAQRPVALRYYDIDRDYQPGLQRAPGRTLPGEGAVIDLPGALSAASARMLAESMARKDVSDRQTLSWRTTTLDPAVRPGALVTVPGEAGVWRVREWEWREAGVELSLQRLPVHAAATAVPSDPGRASPPADLTLSPTLLTAFELPWDGYGTGDTPAIFAAVSSSGAGWTGAALFADYGNDELVSLGPSGRTRAIIGTALDALPECPPHLFDRHSSIEVELADPAFTLPTATPRQLAQGANRALIGSEIVQFARAEPLGAGRWHLSHFLRGRAGTEHSTGSHATGEPFVLLDQTPVALDPALVGSAPATQVVALGRGDAEAVASPIALRGITLRPLTPVHPRRRLLADGALELRWTRRARGAFQWLDGIDAPLGEQAEAWQVGFGPPTSPVAVWEVAEPRLTVPATQLATFATSHPAEGFHVVQRGSFALSLPLSLGPLP